MNASKIPAYIQQRLSGLMPLAAARAAGYSIVGISVAVARLESREDVRRALRQTASGTTPGEAFQPIEGLEVAAARWALKEQYENPLALLLDVMNNPGAPAGLRIQCAKEALPYCHRRMT